MPAKPVQISLTSEERSVIKALLNGGWRNQDIHALITTGRGAPINFARITNVKQDATVTPATAEQVQSFRDKKMRFDHITGLCPIDDERLVRSREAMILAVQLFNTPRVGFKAGVFSMLANVAWTYLLHQHFLDSKKSIYKEDGYTLALSEMLAAKDSPVSPLVCKNLAALRQIRDMTEHHTVGPFDNRWVPIFYACCLNYEQTITNLYGPRLSLGRELGFAMQFAKLTLDELSLLQGYAVPPHIEALDANLASNLAAGEADSLEYQFKVAYTFTASSKSKAAIHFISPDSEEGAEIQNVLMKFKPAEGLYPLRPSDVVKAVAKASGKPFTISHHTNAWKLFKARPPTGDKDPANTDKNFAVFIPAMKAYAYSPAWVTFLGNKIASEKEWEKIKTG